jgi:uncharacterized protein
MIVDIKVTPKAAANKIKNDNGLIRVYVTTAPEDGKANKAVIKMLAKHYGVSQSAVRIIRGATARTKTVEIDDA